MSSASFPKRHRKWLALLAILMVMAAAFAFGVLPQIVENRLNPIVEAPPYKVSDKANALHQKLFVADLHADSLLWSRDLSKRGKRGAVDLPRLVEGNVGLQVFGLVTKTPKGQNFEANDDQSDNITALAFFQRWPRPAWSSPLERALHQARKLAEVERRSEGQLRIVRSQSDLEALLERRQRDSSQVGALLSVEGAHALEGKLEAVDALFQAGIRMISPSHFFDTEVGGSAHGVNKGGLTPFGHQVIARMEELGIVLDLSHASSPTFDDAIAASSRPVVVSHTGVRGTCDNVRNLSDEQLRAVASTGGVVGIAFFSQAVCGVGIDDITKAIVHAVQIIGAEHVALGSDFDGAVRVPFDVSGMALITEALLDAGLSSEQITLIMGENVLRLLRATLPE